jgi:tetratricopeptide (TPR) repeat protein
MGAVHINDKAAATTEMKTLQQLHNQLLAEKDTYKAGQVAIQINTSEAWMEWKWGNSDKALERMRLAATMEDKTEKHPVSPDAVIPARALQSDMLMAVKKYDEALQAYDLDLQKNPNRFNGLYGAGLAAEKAGNMKKAQYYYQALLKFANTTKEARPEIGAAKKFLKHMLR